MNRYYIAGPMTGLPDLNFPAFHAEAKRLRALGHEVENPAEIQIGENPSWADCMRADIKLIMGCDRIILLPGWEKSKGALLEKHIAQEIGIGIDFAEGVSPFKPSALDIASAKAPVLSADLADDKIIALWAEQEKYHGGVPCKPAHVKFARAILAFKKKTEDDLAALTERLQSELVAERAAKAQGAADPVAYSVTYDGEVTNNIFLTIEAAQHHKDRLDRTYDGVRAVLPLYALAPSIQALPVVAPSDSSLIAEARAVFDLMLKGCTYTAFEDWQNGDGETIGPRMDALHARLRTYPAAAQPEAKQAPAALSDEQVRSIFLANGFTIKEGQTDLKPYVYAAASALLAAAGNSQDANGYPAVNYSKDASGDGAVKLRFGSGEWFTVIAFKEAEESHVASNLAVRRAAMAAPSPAEG